jgi:pimeloyl-ACP methyl ester carboxylesterase
MAFTSNYMRCAGLEIHYTDWGKAEKGTVIAWHGLARTGRDMDELAVHLSARGWRVICPDTVGRGLSQWSSAPEQEYCLAFYARIARELMDGLQLRAVHWVGTSMGGLIGMSLAALQDAPISRLVLNDVGAVLPAQALARIARYVGRKQEFESRREADLELRAIFSGFGPHSEAQWRQLINTVLVEVPGTGKVRLHYDPAIAEPFRLAYGSDENNEETNDSADGSAKHPTADVDLWPIYDAIRCPTLLLRGALSDLFTSQVLDEMRTRGPRPEVAEFAGVGHAPTLMHADQIAVVDENSRSPTP